MNFNRLLAISVFGLALAGWQTGDPWPGVAPAWAENHCTADRGWLDPSDGRALSPGDVVADMAERSVVLLGETHDSAEQHRWQLHMIAALHGARPNMAIGLEMLPRAAQPVLDRWVEGALSVADLLEQTDWAEVWGFDPAMYMPIFQFARQNQVSMIALNVDRAVISRIGSQGLAAVPSEEREGVGDPAPATAGYRAMLSRVYVIKARMHGGADHDDQDMHRPPSAEEMREIEADPGFGNFIDAQQTWDRAMAEAIAARLDSGRHAPDLVVAVVGRGHAEFGYGIPHQLADLGVGGAGVLLADSQPCDGLESGIADAVFALGKWHQAAPPKARLGVMIDTGEGGVAVMSVVPESVAAKTGLEAGDLVVEAAGVTVSDTGDLIAIVQRQAPGTWLPLVIRRNDGQLELVAKFPTNF
jgi:uncharacterized iron-regulated protein